MTDDAAATTQYPTEWEADVVLRDGSMAHVRPITPDDADGLRRFHDAQSEESVYLRFFAPIKHLSDKDVHRFTHVDHDDRVALVALVAGEIIGVARYDRLDDRSTAEVAFNISDSFHGKGVGSVMLEHLAAIAQEAGVAKFIADVLPQNRKMMKVFTDAGYEVEHHFDDGVIAVSFRIEPTDASQAVQLAREHRAEAQSMQRVLAPTSVAVVGVSRRPDAIGSIVVDNILDAGFAGAVHIVNSEAVTVRGLAANAKVSDIEGGVDLAVICVPADAVLDVVDDCARAGVGTLLVISSGFAEAGPQGEQRQDALLARARQYGMRVVGPNSFGLANNHPDVRLDASIGRDLPPVGNLGVFSQSGGLGVGLLAAASRRSLGVSVFASAGNRVDVSGNDLMQYWIDDDQTKVVGLYLESVGNARKFSRIARQLSLRKPVVCVKSRTSGQVPPGHRARSTRVDAAAFQALLDQAGVIQAGSIHELMDICEIVSHQPLPAGNRLAVVGNSQGMNAIVKESAARAGLLVTHGPVGLPLQVGVREAADAVEAALADDAVDAVITCFIPPLGSSEEEVAGAVAHVAWGYDKPITATFLGMRDVAPVLRRAAKPVGETEGEQRVVPAYETVLDAVSALAAATRYAQWRNSEHGERVRPSGVNRGAAVRLVERVLQEAPQGRDLTGDETTTLLAAYGVELWPDLPACGEQEAVDAASVLGYPVVLKSMIPAVRAVPGSGGVRSDLHTEAEVRGAFASLTERLRAFGDPMIAVQKMAPPGVPTVLSTAEDPLFGPVVSFGLAGPPSELLHDVAHRIPPLTDVDVAALVGSLKAAPLLDGYRGSAAVDHAALYDLITRVAALADDLPEISHLHLTTVNAHAEGADVLAAEVSIAPASTRTDVGRRALA